MLKNKKAIFILVVVNFAVWGIFIYRFFCAFVGPEVADQSEKSSTGKHNERQDTALYKLALNYRDPFLKDKKSNRTTSHGKNTVRATVKPVKIPGPVAPVPTTIALPDVVYMGIIRNSNSGSVTALVTVNGASKLIKPNDIVEGITFKSFSRDSLVAEWGKEKIIVRK